MKTINILSQTRLLAILIFSGIFPTIYDYAHIVERTYIGSFWSETAMLITVCEPGNLESQSNF